MTICRWPVLPVEVQVIYISSHFWWPFVLLVHSSLSISTSYFPCCFFFTLFITAYCIFNSNQWHASFKYKRWELHILKLKYTIIKVRVIKEIIKREKVCECYERKDGGIGRQGWDGKWNTCDVKWGNCNTKINVGRLKWIRQLDRLKYLINVSIASCSLLLWLCT